MLSCSVVSDSSTPWTVNRQAPLSMGFSRQEYWNGLPFPSPGIFLNQGSNPGLLHCRWILYCLSHQGSPDVIISSVQLLSYVRLFATAWTVACQAFLSITNSWSSLKLMSIESMMPSNHFILCHSFFSCPQSFPTSGSFPMSHLFPSGGQSTGASASVSVLAMNIQG